MSKRVKVGLMLCFAANLMLEALTVTKSSDREILDVTVSIPGSARLTLFQRKEIREVLRNL